MAPIKQEVNIGMEPYLGIVQKGAALNVWNTWCKAGRRCSTI
jgi:hypothetical protein